LRDTNVQPSKETDVLITQSVHGVAIRLTTERWEHICHRHPDLRAQQERVLERRRIWTQ